MHALAPAHETTQHQLAGPGFESYRDGVLVPATTPEANQPEFNALGHESYHSGAFIVERGKFDRGLMASMQAELEALYPEDATKSSTHVNSGYMHWSSQPKEGVMPLDSGRDVSTFAALNQLGVMDGNADHMQINFQAPGSRQTMHVDSVWFEDQVRPEDEHWGEGEMVAIIHCTDGGAFDFELGESGSVQTAEKDFDRIRLNAGDVVYNRVSRHLYHRGANPSDTRRITVGIPLRRALSV